MYGDENPSLAPAKDLNAPIPPVPAEYTDEVPGFLQALCDEYDEVQDELNRIWADRYGSPSPIGNKPKPSNILEDMRRTRREEELERRKEMLIGAIREFRALIPSKE